MQVTWLAFIKLIFEVVGFLAAIPTLITVITKAHKWWKSNQLDTQMLFALGKPLLFFMLAMAFIVWSETIARYIRKICGVDGRAFLKHFKGRGYRVHISRAGEVFVESDPFCWQCKCQLKAPNKRARFDPLRYLCGRCGAEEEIWQGEVDLHREHVKSLVERDLRGWNLGRMFGDVYRALKGFVVLTVITLVSVGVLVQSWVLFLERH